MICGICITLRMNTELMFSSEKQDWTTPKAFFEKLAAQHNFVLDAACESHNKLCAFGYEHDLGVDSLQQDWAKDTGGGLVWINPPYGKALPLFVKKAYEESLKGCKIIMLIPSRTDTSYWHKYIFNQPNVRVEFLKGRLKFGNSKNSAPFGSALIYFNL